MKLLNAMPITFIENSIKKLPVMHFMKEKNQFCLIILLKIYLNLLGRRIKSWKNLWNIVKKLTNRMIRPIDFFQLAPTAQKWLEKTRKGITLLKSFGPMKYLIKFFTLPFVELSMTPKMNLSRIG